MRNLRIIAILVVALTAGLALPALAGAQQVPSAEAVLVALRDMSLGLDGLQVRSTLATDAGGTALLQLDDGTLVDLRLVAVENGWSVRGVSLIAGSVDSFHGWSRPWATRVQAAENFLAGVEAGGLPTRTAEELAPLSWFEDPDASARLWGMNPVTYRMMQTLQMMPSLSGPTGGGSPTNPVPRR